MGPEKSLPIDASFSSPEAYISSLLNLVTTSKLVRTLCGGVHMLEFFTFEPGLYTAILPETWRDFFGAHDIMDVLDLLMREDLDRLDHAPWKTGRMPPEDLLEYIRNVRRHTFDHRFDGPEPTPLTREVALGMGVKKVHEVGQFTSYISRLTEDLAAASPDRSITHIIDLGSGQGYLPRALASPPHDHTVVGVESREHNVAGSQNWDILAKLAPKPAPIMRNKKVYKEELAQQRANGTVPVKVDPSKRDRKGERGFFSHPGLPNLSVPADREDVNVSCMPTSQGAVQYVSHYLLDGDLTRITSQILAPSSLDTIRHNAPLDPEDKRLLPRAAPEDIRALVIGLHACGNLTHHGLRSLLLTPSVRAVALVGCCYNLLTERLGPPTFKLDSLRGRNTRLEVQQNSHDPHGFPMSERFCTYPSPLDGPDSLGVRLNITARMMAVQAPRNWTRNDSEGFFRRHFYRALLQRVFVDLGLVPAPRPDWGAKATSATRENNGNGDDQDSAPATDPVILGSLPRKSYASFLSYVRAASAKLGRHETHPTFSVERARAFSAALAGMSDEDVQGYEEKYAHRKKELEVVWSLMAFTAGVVEAAIVTDRWCWVREQGVRGWVEAVFGYGVSPRNMVVVGVKD